MDFGLKGKKALVCGASKGIGASCAKVLAASGARVLLVARNEAELQLRLQELPGEGHDYLALDLSDLKSVRSEIPLKVKAYGGFDILVCNAGGPKAGSLLSATPEEFIKAFETHVLASSYLAQVVTPNMKKNNYGRIINIISTSVKAPIPNLGVSNTIRAAVASWAKTLAHEVGSFGITVNNVLPGYTKTSRLETLKMNTAEKQNISEAEVESMWLLQIPAKRFGEPEEIANAVAFLASPLASYINGINLPVDGGRTQSL
ncbi:MAG: SDR family oxidoreductase [Bdellovibrionales bacterium]|nr:SDR family oxidoreductase [Bdellovibrionales bacterium]